MALLNYTSKFDATFSADGPGLHPQGQAHVETMTKHATHAPADAIIVPDSQLLFNGDFKREGVDLVLSHDHHELVLHDYFKGEKRAALSSPDGAHLTGDLVNALTGHTEYAQADGSAAAGKVIGHVTKLTGTATIVRNGVSIILNNGDNVEKGDVVQSGSDSTLGITFIDGTVFGLSSNARMVLNEMVYDPNGSNNSSLISLVAGTISFVAGETAKHGDMKVDTPVATMGIRGTAVLVEIDFNVPGTGGAPDAKFQVLVEPDGTTGSYILFDKNTLTPIATVNQAGQQINISQGQVSITNEPLPLDMQKLIQDVFSLKFTDSNPKSFEHFTDSVVPQPFNGIRLANGDVLLPTFHLDVTEKSTTAIQTGELFVPFVAVKIVEVIPVVNKASFAIADQVFITDTFPSDTVTPYVPGTATILSVSGPSVIPAGLDLAKLLTVDPATGAVNYDPAKFAFLGANQNVVITIAFDSRAGSDTFHETLNVTILGTNAAPIIVAGSTTATGAIGETASVTGSTTNDSAAGSIAFGDINLSDVHTVSHAAPTFTWSGGTLSTAQIAAITSASTLALTETDSTGNGSGSVAWNYSAQDKSFDFLAAGQTLTVIYAVTVNDGQGGTAIQNVGVTITGTNDTPVVTAHSDGAVTEDAMSSKLTSVGTVSFTDVDLTDTHTVSVNPVGTTLGTLTAAVSTDTSNGLGGEVSWTYTVADSATDYLAAGQTKVEHFTVSVDDGHGGTTSQDVAVTITGIDETPTILTTSGAITESPGTGNATIDHATGTITFADVDLTDRPAVSAQFTSFTFQDASHNDVTSSLTPEQDADIAAVEASLALTPSTANANDGSVNWSYDVADDKFDFLAAGEVLTLTYTASVDDGHGGLVSKPIAVAITGTDDAPMIQNESNPPTQAVIVLGSTTPTILSQGVNTNSIGFTTETFDGLASGSPSNNGVGYGDFFSAGLNATFTASGNAGIVNGSVADVTGAPFIGPLPGAADTTNYLSVGAGGTETITFASEENTFGLYWGSVDPYNTISFYHGSTLVASYTGADVSPLFSDGNQGSFSSNGYVEFSGLAPFDEVVLGSGDTNAFEVENISAGSVHVQLAAPIAGTLTVSDADIGDTLTASVTGNGTIAYNGSATPANVDATALIAASDIKFDSVTSNGGAEILNWTYNPTNPGLDFLKAGDTLTVTFTAQVNDGHGGVVNQPLTINIVGADKSADASGFQVVSGTTQNDTFNNIGNGVTIFGGGGNDTFVFNAAFQSATIGDFNVDKDTIDISHTLFASLSAILASAQSTNSGHDTIITDSAHDTITLKGVSLAQIQAHPSDFHLV